MGVTAASLAFTVGRATAETTSVTISASDDNQLIATPADSLIIMNLNRGHLYGSTTSNSSFDIAADVQIDSLIISDGYWQTTYNFSGDISGAGTFERTSDAKGANQTYVFTGDMSAYSGDMKFSRENDGNTFKFVGNQSGTGTITIAAGNTLVVDGATMNNSSITSNGTLNVLNKATFNHNVNVNGNLFLGAGALIINDGLFTFGDAVTLNLSNVDYTINDQGQRVFSLFSSDSTGTSNFSSLTANNLSVIEKVGWDWSFNQNGTIVATRLGRDVSYAGGTLSWSTAADNKSFTQGSAAVSFEQGDNVTFAADSQVTLAEDIQATRVIVGSEAEVAVHTAGHALAADIVEVEGALRYQLGGENSSILDLKGAGTLVLDNADADSAASFSIGGDVSAFTGGLTVQGNTTLALQGKANGLVSASEASVTIGDGAVLKVENIAGWHTIWRLNDAKNLHTTGTGTIDVVDRGWLTEDVDIHKNFSCETSFDLHGDGYYSNKRRNVYVGEGAGFYVNDTLTLKTYVALVVQGGTIDAGTLAVGNAQYWSKFFMSSGLLTAGSIMLSSDNGGTEVNISGGCVEFTQSQALNRAGNSAPYVRIVGSGPDSTVTLKATRTDWTLDGAGLNNKPVIGNITVDAGNTHGITLANGALTGSIVNNAGLTLGEGISVAAGSSAVLSGASIAIDRTITNAGTLSLQTGSVSVSRENLQHLEISTEGATIAYSLDGKNFVTDGSENGFRHLTNARYYLAAGGNLSVAQGLQAQVGENSYNIFADATGLGFIVPETSRSDVFVVNSGNVTVGAEAQAIAESYEINGGTMVLNAGSVAGESVHFNSASSALHIGGESSITGTLVLNQGSVTVSGATASAHALSVNGSGRVIIGKDATLNITTEQTASNVAFSYMEGEGTLGLTLSTNNYSQSLAIGSNFAGTTHVQAGYFTINNSTFGNTLRLANGVNFQLDGGSTVILGKNLVLDGTTQVHQNSNADLTINGTVSGAGTYERKGGGTLTFNGGVALKSFTQGVNATTVFNGDSTLESLSVTSGTVKIGTGATLNITTAKTSGDYAISNITGTGTLGVKLGTGYGQKLAVATGFTGTTHVLSGTFTLNDSTFGNTLKLADGVNFQLTGVSTVQLDKNLVLEGTSQIYQNTSAGKVGATLNIMGTVSGSGTYDRRGGGVLTFNESVALGGLKHIESAGTTMLKGNTTLGTLALTKGKVEVYRDAEIHALSMSNDGSLQVREQGVLKLENATNGAQVQISKADAEVKSASSAASGYDVSSSDYEIKNAHVKVTSADSVNLANKLTQTSVENAGRGTLSVTNSINSLAGVLASGGDMTLLNLAKNASLDILDIAAGKTVSAYVGSNADDAQKGAVAVTGSATFGAGSSLNASLTLADGATLDMDALDVGAVTLNGALTFGGQVTMGDKLLGILSEMSGWEESVTLFTGLTDLVLPAVAADDAADRLWVGDVFSNLAGNENYYFNYVPEVGSLAVVHVPEPATTTLGLLALSALAARRRRK